MVYYRMIMKIKKVLIIRFSSFGDIVQCSSVVELICQKFPDAQIDWVTRSEFDYLVKLNHGVNHVWSFDKKTGFKGLLDLGRKLKAENYDQVYDAHNNLRSGLLSLMMRSRLAGRPDWLTRSKSRLRRILLFTFRINTFPKPFKGIHSFEKPLEKWGIEFREKNKFVSWDFPENTITKTKPFVSTGNEIILVPSAAWEMKRWPLDLWKKLIQIMPEKKFVVLGGREDLFCEELKAISPDRVENLAGKLTLVESCALILSSPLVVSADTGLLHVADVLGVKGLALIGPTAFGFTSGSQIKTMEVELSCRPCTKDGRGNCSQDVYQKCMVNITPEQVALSVRQMLRE